MAFDPKKFLTSLSKRLGYEDAAIASEGIPVNDIVAFTDTGSYALNGLLSGSIYKGIPNGKILGLAGDEATGKTYFTIEIMYYWLQANPMGFVICYETEGAITSKMFIERLGMEFAGRVLVVPINTVQELKHKANALLDDYGKMKVDDRPKYFMVLDSLGMMTTEKEKADAIEGKFVQDMTRTQQIKSCFRTLTRPLARYGIPFIVTNHTYVQIGSTSYEKEMGGGNGLKYAASIILYLSKKMDKNAVTGERYGNIIHVKQKKGRLTKEGEQIDCKLSFSSGLSRYWFLTDILILTEKLKMDGTKILWPDGKKYYAKSIYAKPEKYFTPDIMKMADEACAELYNYGAEEVLEEDAEDVDEVVQSLEGAK